MMEMPKYNYPVSLIPGGCPQFLDFCADLSETPELLRIIRFFREERRPGSMGEGRENYALFCLDETDNGSWAEQISGAPSAPPSHEISVRKCLERFYDQWIPVPFFRQRETKHPDGEPMYEPGPANWARCRIVRPAKGSQKLRIVMIFDTTVEEPPKDSAHYVALSPADVAANAVFGLAWHVRDNTWFLNAGWVDKWLFDLDEKYRSSHRLHDDPFYTGHLAQYLTLLDFLHRLLPLVQVRVINPDRDTPVDVDLILDIGNSRTTGILVETPPQRATSLTNSYLMQIRDLSEPENIYQEPFATRVEFSEASFGDDAYSKRSGRKTPAFTWPSAVRMGPEAARLATFSKGVEGTTGMSSPKRYLWDERIWKPTWRFNTMGGYEPMVTRGSFAKQVNHMGTPLSCFDDPAISRNPLYSRQEREIAFESQFTRSSLMMFLMAEVIMQTLVTINSPAQRSRRELADLPRRLRRVIFTVPSGMPIAEQRIYRRWVRFAVRTVWDALGWQQWYISPRAGRPSGKDYRQSPETKCSWDEASCTQLVYLYNEITQKFPGDAHHFFRITGKKREGYGEHESLRVASIDVGGGTTDLSIATYTLENDEHSAVRVRPKLNMRDGFNIAGDDIVKAVITETLFPAIEKNMEQSGVFSAYHIMGQCFGRDVIDNSQENRNLRAQFARQIAMPAALGMLSAYEASDPMNNTPVTYALGDFFQAPESAENTLPFTPAPSPDQAIINYLEKAVQKTSPSSGFSLMQTLVTISPASMELVVQSCIGRIVSDLCEVVYLYDCDVLLLTGRPSRLDAIINSVTARLPVPADRIIPMCQYRTGRWYPFADPLGMISDPKTTVSVGAILCALAEGHLEGFSFATRELRLIPTARHIGELDTNGQLTKAKVWFDVDVNQPGEKEMERVVSFTGPLSIGFRQLPVNRWPTTRFYLMNFATEDDRRLSEGKLPYSVTVRYHSEDLEFNSSVEDQDEGELSIIAVTDRNGNEVRGGVRAVELRLQTLPLDEGYWLDTGILLTT